MQHSLAMNNIIDISDGSEGSHLDIFDDESIKNLKSLLKDNPDLQAQQHDCSLMEDIIKKVNALYRFMKDISYLANYLRAIV